MLFRDSKGNLVEICKNNYITDKEYYYAIMKTKGYIQTSSKCDEFDRIITLIKK